MYDSATPTALALRALERANLTTQARRARLNTGFGLNDDGSMNADTSGSIYQGNLNSVQNEQAANSADHRRGFSGPGGLGHKLGAQAHEAGLMRQSGMLKDAFGQVADTRQEEANNKGVYEDQITQIGANSAAAAAQDLIDHPIQGAPPSAPTPDAPPPVTNTHVTSSASTPASDIGGAKAAAAARSAAAAALIARQAAAQRANPRNRL